MDYSFAKISLRLRNRLFRLHGTQTEPIVIGHSRIYLIPSKWGVIFGSMLMAMMLASINYALSLGLVLTFSLGGIALAGTMRGFRNVLGLEVRHGRTTPVFCGTPVVFNLVLRNHLPRMRFSLEGVVEDYVSPLLHLPAKESGELAIQVPSQTRGWVTLPWVKLQTCYPMGLVHLWAYVRPNLRVLVYPQPELQAPPLPPTPGTQGAQTIAGSGAEDFNGLRSYQPTDQPRHIAWKVVARDGPMLVKQFQGVAGGKVTLDWANLPDSLSVEKKISRLTAWVCKAHAQGASWRLVTPEVDLGPDRGESHYHHCLTALALHGKNSD